MRFGLGCAVIDDLSRSDYDATALFPCILVHLVGFYLQVRNSPLWNFPRKTDLFTLPDGFLNAMALV